MITLLETQRSLKRLILPDVDRLHSMRFRDFLAEGSVFTALRHAAFTVTPCVSSDQDMHDIVKLSLNLHNLHLRLCSIGVDNEDQLPAIILRK
jgi:hypothetical protein